MRGKISRGPAEFSQELCGGNLPAHTIEAVDEDGHFFAEGRWRRRLAVRAREHRRCRVFDGQRTESGYGPLQGGRPHQFHRIPHRQGVGEIVDVFARARDVCQFG